MSQHHHVQESLPTESPTLLFGPKIDTSFRSLPAFCSLSSKKTKVRVGVRPRHDGGSSLCCEVLWSENTTTEPDTGEVWQGEGGRRRVAGNGHSFVHSFTWRTFIKQILCVRYTVRRWVQPSPGSPGTHHPAGEKHITQIMPT